jgi:predicted transcriptional regulator of viral defense system
MTAAAILRAAAALADANPVRALQLIEEAAELLRFAAADRALSVEAVLRAAEAPLTTRDVARLVALGPTRTRTLLLRAEARGAVRRCGIGPATVWTARRAVAS